MLVASVCGLKEDRRLKQFMWEDFSRLSLKWHEAEKRSTAIMFISERRGGMSFSTALRPPLRGFSSPHSVLKGGMDCTGILK